MRYEKILKYFKHHLESTDEIDKVFEINGMKTVKLLDIPNLEKTYLVTAEVGVLLSNGEFGILDKSFELNTPILDMGIRQIKINEYLNNVIMKNGKE